MFLPSLTYLTVDSVAEGVGQSQVVRYVEGLARRGLDVRLHSFEKGSPPAAVSQGLAEAGVTWRSHPFGTSGSRGGLGRVGRGAAAVAGSRLVHARSDLAAASCLISGRRRWIWDMRSFWREQRTALGLLREGSTEDRVMRRVEAAAARSSTIIITLTHAAAEVMGRRFGDEVRAKCRVVTTCVDLDRFQVSALPAAPPVRLLLAGTLNELYDVPAMLRLVDRVSLRSSAALTILSPDAGSWQERFAAAGSSSRAVASEDMPGMVAGHHAGLSVLRAEPDIGNAAAMPTKLGEFLAAGRPVVVNAGLGDMDALIAAHRCGVVIRGRTDTHLDRAAEDLLELLADPGTAGRCRAVAEEHFSLDRGLSALIECYREACG